MYKHREINIIEEELIANCIIKDKILSLHLNKKLLHDQMTIKKIERNLWFEE